MELGKHIKKHRTDMNLSQEALAEKLFVTRQTISNWENDKNYPDIHSLLLMSTLFETSLDQLIQGDVQMMKTEINKSDVQAFNRNATAMLILVVLFVVTMVPLGHFLGVYGYVISAMIAIAALYFAFNIEKLKKTHDIQTYKEVLAFTEGQHLDEIKKNQEIGKRPYQKIFLAVGWGLFAFLVSWGVHWLMQGWIG